MARQFRESDERETQVNQPANANRYFDFAASSLPAYQKSAYAEAVRAFGYDVKYIPAEFLESDINWVFGEVSRVKYTEAFDVRMSVEGYDDLHKALLNYNKYGMFIQPDSVEMSVGKDDFMSIVSETVKPKSGDLIMFYVHGEEVLMEVTSATLKFDSFFLFSVKLYNYNAMTTIATGEQGPDSASTLEDSVKLPVEMTGNEKIEEIDSENEDFGRVNSVWGTY